MQFEAAKVGRGSVKKLKRELGSPHKDLFIVG